MVAGNSVAALKRRIAEIEGRDLCFEEPVSASVPNPVPNSVIGPVTDLVTGTGPKLARESAFPHWTLGLDVVDGALPNGGPGSGLAIAGLHEIMADYAHMPAAGGFCAALVVRLLRGLDRSGRKTVLWCARGKETRAFGVPYGPGLAHMGLAPGNLIFVRAEKTPDLLWAMEEGIKTPALAAVVGEVGPADLAASRRLLLAARKSGVPGIILRSSDEHGPSAAITTWRVESMLSGSDELQTPQMAPGAARWRVTLERARGPSSGPEAGPEAGMGEAKWPQSWNLEWNRETHTFNMAAVLANRPDWPAKKTNRPDWPAKKTNRSLGEPANRKSA